MKQDPAMKATPASILLRCFLINWPIDFSIIKQFSMQQIGLSHLATTYRLYFQLANLIYIFEKNMIDFNRTFCDLHPNELITNFCCKDQCNVGLCATCICNHTETHIQKKTAPEYENIRATYSRIQENIRSRIGKFQLEKVRINNVIDVIRNKRKQITETIQQARHETLDFVNKFYEAKQKQLVRKIQADEKKVGLHNENRMQSLLNVISRDINSLFASAQDLNSQAFLESFHRIRTQTLVNSSKTYREVDEELLKNQNYQVGVSVSVPFINQIKAALQKSINVYFGQKRKQRPQSSKDNNQYQRQSNSIDLPTAVSQNMISQPNSESHIPQFHRSQYPQRFQSQRFQPQRFQVKKNQPLRPSSVSKVGTPVFQQRYVNNVTQVSSPKFFTQPRPNNSFIHTLQQPSEAPLIRNNSIQILQSNPNYQNFSRIQIRGNSGQKGFKQNYLNRSSIINQSQTPFIESSYNQTASDLTKKSRRGGLGLSVIKSNDQLKNLA